MTTIAPPMAPSMAAGPPQPVRAPGGQNLAAMRRAAQEFEAQALGALLQPMFQGLETRGPFGGGAAEAQWRPMLVDAIAKDLARAGGLGLSDAVLREMTRIAAAQQQPTPATETPTP